MSKIDEDAKSEEGKGLSLILKTEKEGKGTETMRLDRAERKGLSHGRGESLGWVDWIEKLSTRYRQWSD